MRAPSGTVDRRATTLLALLAALLASVLVPSVAHGSTAAVHGTVRDDAGRPLEGARVVVPAPVTGVSYTVWDTHDDWPFADVTDADGRYEITGLPARSPTSTSFTVRGSAPGHATEAARGPDGQDLYVDPAAGERMRVDLTLRTIGSVIRGRVTLRGGLPAGRPEIRVRTEGAAGYSTPATVDDDGRYEIHLPAGEHRIEATSPLGLRGYWPDLPGARYDGPPLVLGRDAVREDVDIVLRPRLPYAATDQYGEAHAGTDPDRPATDPPRRYPEDDTPSVLSTVGARAEVGRPLHGFAKLLEQHGLEEARWVVEGWGYNRFTVAVTNHGDADLFLRRTSFDGPDAALFSCTPHDLAQGPQSCAPAVVLPGRTTTVPVVLDQDTPRDVYRATLTIETNAPGGPHRVPFEVTRLKPPPLGPGWTPPDAGAGATTVPGSAVPPPASTTPSRSTPPAAATRSGTARRASPTRSLKLTRSAVRLALPAAGAVRVRIDRRRPGAGAARWRKVRDVRLRARRAGAVRRSVRTLAAGRYRVRLRVTLRGASTRSTTTYRRVSRR
ncbi:MAG: carboxypeptidase regulatory-like domain-containing protein [Solirubrobacteraceae bacterium]|nr:carboxypeptidase regulatory-like domain-containing protein [Solirubrobacteraceae bacterium]